MFGFYHAVKQLFNIAAQSISYIPCAISEIEDEESQMLSLQNLARLKNQCRLEDVGLKEQ